MKLAAESARARRGKGEVPLDPESLKFVESLVQLTVESGEVYNVAIEDNEEESDKKKRDLEPVVAQFRWFLLVFSR